MRAVGIDVGKAALMACMRKLLTIINARRRDDCVGACGPERRLTSNHKTVAEFSGAKPR